jgi:hypothetical protein
LKGTLSCGAFSNATLTGNLSGVQPVVLSKTIDSLFDDTKKAFSYSITFGGQSGTKGDLTITPKQIITASAGASDLPLIPTLASTLKINGYAVTPEHLDPTTYDPLRGDLEFTLTNSGGNYGLIRCPVVASDLKGEMVSPALNCDVFVGSNATAKMVGAPVSDKAVDSLVSEPPKYFKGYYVTSPTTRYVAVASLEYKQKDNPNPAGSILPVYPQMEMMVYICNGTQRIGYAPFESASFNGVTSQAVFTYTNPTTNSSFDMDVTFVPGFNSFRGDLLTTAASNGSSASYYQFTALANQSSWAICETK